MARGASLYDFRDLDIMHRLAELNGKGASSPEVADLLGFPAEEGSRNVGMRLAWMRRYGMVAFDDAERTWALSDSGRRVASAHLRAPQLKVVEAMPDEQMIETMALITSRYQRGEPLIAHMLRREFAYGTTRR